MHQEVMKLAEEKALQGDGQFAIAFAILTLAKEHRELQQNLTFGDWDMGDKRYPGVLERLGMEVEALALAVGYIGESAEKIADKE